MEPSMVYFIFWNFNLNPDTPTILRRTLVRKIDERYNFMRTCISSKVESVTYVWITADAWTCDGKSRSFMGLTVHWV